MKTKTLIGMITLSLASTLSFAQQTEYVAPDAGFVSTKTRAQVKEELARSKADGSFDRLHAEVQRPDEGFVSTKTRAQVYAELIESQRDGSYARTHSEFVSPTDGFISTKTRNEVKRERDVAIANGSLNAANQDLYRN
jgi:polyisoprenoid-binding protein YceI